MHKCIALSFWPFGQPCQPIRTVDMRKGSLILKARYLITHAIRKIPVGRANNTFWQDAKYVAPFFFVVGMGIEGFMIATGFCKCAQIDVY